MFNELNVSKQKSSNNISNLKIGDTDIEYSNDIANDFNILFVTVASKLKELVQTPNFDKLKSFCEEKLPENTLFNIPEISVDPVLKFLVNIDVTKSTWSDNIGPRLLQLSAYYIADNITFICNKNLKESIFPKNRKRAKSHPCIKMGQKMI